MDSVEFPNRRILFTPGPLTTSKAVKASLVCEDQSPRDSKFMTTLRAVRQRLANIVSSTTNYKSVLLSCSGTGAVESMLLAAARKQKPVLIINNGAYGQRMIDIASAYGIPYQEISSPPLEAIDITIIEQALQENQGNYSALAVVHHETTTGLLNDIRALGVICSKHNVPFIVDAMSSFAALDIDMAAMHIDMLATSSNKNLQGMPGVGVIVLEAEYAQKLAQYPTNSFYLDCLAELDAQENNGQGRFTLPVQIIQSMSKALDEFESEGRLNRLARYQNNWTVLKKELTKQGFQFLLAEHLQSKLILSVLEPSAPELSFKAINQYMSNRGIDIYPGKLPGVKYFRLCTVGDLYESDMQRFIAELQSLIFNNQPIVEVI